MKLPKTIRILGHTYTVKEMECGRALDGKYDPDNRVILIHRGLSDKEMLDTLWHEILHAIEGTLGFDISHHVLQNISAGQFAVLMDNPGLFDLKSGSR